MDSIHHILPRSVWTFYLNRAESRADARHMDAKLKSHQDLMAGFLQGIKDEMKDFHGRLCAIEERRKL